MIEPQVEVMTAGQACRLLGVSDTTLLRWTEQGKVRAIRTLGGHRRYAREDIVAVKAEMEAS